MTLINGSATEIFHLLNILDKYCSDPPDIEKECPAHSMLSMAQKQMDALVFYRRYWEKRSSIDR